MKEVKEVDEMEEACMTDLQYKDHLRAVIADFEWVRKAGVSPEAELVIDEIIERYKKSIED